MTQACIWTACVRVRPTYKFGCVCMSLIRSIGTIRQLQHNDQWLRLHCPFMCRKWLLYTTVCATSEIRASSDLWSRRFERQRQYVATYTDSCLNTKKKECFWPPMYTTAFNGEHYTWYTSSEDTSKFVTFPYFWLPTRPTQPLILSGR